MRVTFVIASLNSGGAERVASSMANYWAEKDWPISLLTMCGGRQDSSFDVHPNVEHHDLGVNPRCHSMPDEGMARLLETLNHSSPAERSVFIPDFNLVMALRAVIVNTRPEVIISFIDVTNVRTLLATCGLRIPVIVSEHSDPYHNHIGLGWDGLRRRSYPEAKYLTVPTSEAARYFSHFMNGQVRVIPNPIPNFAARDDVEARVNRGEGRTLLAMGRLAFEKGFDLLLEAFALIAHRQPTWCLQIWGEGPLRGELESLAAALGLAERVSFPGFAKQPFDVMRQADLFVVPSRCEGFSNVLAEAMACRLPVVSFDCPSGPRHIVQDGIDGILVSPQDVPAMASTLERLMANESERVRLSSAAAESSKRFGIDKVMSKWTELVLSANN